MTGPDDAKSPPRYGTIRDPGNVSSPPVAPRWDSAFNSILSPHEKFSDRIDSDPEGNTMIGNSPSTRRESKIEATDRLRREGRWKYADIYREQQRQLLRNEGRTRAEAREMAWDRMIAAFPSTAAWDTDKLSGPIHSDVLLHLGMFNLRPEVPPEMDTVDYRLAWIG